MNYCNTGKTLGSLNEFICFQLRGLQSVYLEQANRTLLFFARDHFFQNPEEDVESINSY